MTLPLRSTIASGMGLSRGCGTGGARYPPLENLFYSRPPAPLAAFREPTMTQTPVAGLDFYDPDTYVVGVPHDTFTRLRRESPVLWCPEDDGPGFWSVLKHADVQAINRDWETFSSAQGTNIPDWTDEQSGLGMMMLYMDPTKHTRYRLLVNKGFTPRMINKLKETIVERARTIVDNVIERGECDFVVDIAAELPLQAIADLMGVPMEDRYKLFDWSNRMVGSEDPEYQVSDDHTTQAQTEMYLYANQLAAEKREHPADDIISTLVRAEVDFEGQRQQLSELEFDLFFMLLSVAGNETTRNLIAHGMLAFFEHPEQWQKLCAQPALLDSAVEEMLRWGSPVMHFRRTATRDYDLHGQHIRTGDKVVIWYISANRDEDVFADPFSFDITRDPNDHVAFGGGGPHFCLGANLARMEIRVMFDELVRRLPDIRQGGPAQRLRSNFINGIKHLPVEFAPKKLVTPS
jgi:cholest-4-en-3-one 26-monooxygenase